MMASSCRSALKRGGIAEWEAPLREAVRLIRGVIDEVWETIGDDGQYDNAADDGGLAERLGIACDFINGELPKVAQVPFDPPALVNGGPPTDALDGGR